MQEYTGLKEICQVYSNENPKRIYTNMDDDETLLKALLFQTLA
jgi:hypothetical protein